jgi:hypothetical protein
MQNYIMNANDKHQVNTSGCRTMGAACLDSCQKILAHVENARARIFDEFRENLVGHEHLLKLAVNEAEALAWQTGFPQLLFPALAAEKARDVAAWHERQRLLHPHGVAREAAA